MGENDELLSEAETLVVILELCIRNCVASDAYCHLLQHLHLLFEEP